MKNILDINENELNKIYACDGATVLAIYGKNIGLSMEMFPILEELKEEYKDDLNIFSIDATINKNIGPSFMVRALPTLVLFNNGVLLGIKTGAGTKLQILTWIRRRILL